MHIPTVSGPGVDVPLIIRAFRPKTVQGQEGDTKIRASTWEGQEVSLLRKHLLRPTVIATLHLNASLPVSLASIA